MELPQASKDLKYTFKYTSFCIQNKLCQELEIVVSHRLQTARHISTDRLWRFSEIRLVEKNK